MNLGESIGFFGEASSKIINTAVLGEVKIEIVFTSQIASCILGSSSVADGPIFNNTASTLNTRLRDDAGADRTFDTAANMAATNSEFHRRRAAFQNFTNGYTMGDTGLEIAGNYNDAHDDTATNAQINADTNNTYEIRDIILHIEALQLKTRDYYDVINRLVESGQYKYHFKRYVLQTDTATVDRKIDYRLVVNSECLNYVLATFRPAGYDTLANPVNTLISPQSVGHFGVANCSWSKKVRIVLPFTIIQSKF